jgi:hypothetical protein
MMEDWLKWVVSTVSAMGGRADRKSGARWHCVFLL